MLAYQQKESTFFFQAEDGIRDVAVTGVQTCALPISSCSSTRRPFSRVAASTRSPDWAAAPPAARTRRTRATRNARIVLPSVSSGFYAALGRAPPPPPPSPPGRGGRVAGGPRPAPPSAPPPPPPPPARR